MQRKNGRKKRKKPSFALKLILDQKQINKAINNNNNSEQQTTISINKLRKTNERANKRATEKHRAIGKFFRLFFHMTFLLFQRSDSRNENHCSITLLLTLRLRLKDEHWPKFSANISLSSTFFKAVNNNKLDQKQKKKSPAPTPRSVKTNRPHQRSCKDCCLFPLFLFYSHLLTLPLSLTIGENLKTD